MAGHYFEVGSRFIINDNEYLVRRDLDLDIEVENMSYRKIEIRRKEVLFNLWLEGCLLFRVSKEEEELIRTHNLDDLNIDLRNKALERYRILEPVIKGEVLPSEIKEYLQTLGGTVKKSTFYEWKKRWEQTEDIRALVSKKPGPKGSHSINGKKLEIMDEAIEYCLYSDGKSTIEDMYSEFLLRIDEENLIRDKDDKLTYSSRSTIRRRREQIIDIYRKDKEKYGVVLARLKKDGTKKEIIATRPLERVEIDWTPVDVMLIDPVDLKATRPDLIYAVDKYSGIPMGFFLTFKPVDSNALKQCLIHAIMPKTYLKDLYPLVENDWVAHGIPHTIVVDNATVNDSYEFEEACYQVGIKEVQFCTIGAGHQKATIERSFKKLNTMFIHNLKGTTFSNFIEKGVYDSSKKACITMQGFTYMAHIAMVDMITHYYEKRRGDSPHNLWLKGIEQNKHLKIQIPRSVDSLKILLVGGSELRKVQQQGVVIENEYYYSKALMELKNTLEALNKQDEKVRVRYDLSDMRKVYVYDPINNRYIVAEATSLVRKKINVEYPVPLIALELDSKIKTETKNSFDPRIRAKGQRKIKLIQQEDEKKIQKWKKGQTPDESIDSSFLTTAVLTTETKVDIPINNEEIIILKEKTESKRSKKKNKSDTFQDKKDYSDYMEYDDTDIEELPSWNVTIKNKKEDSDSCA
ncbi:transposase family protein [Metabacillus litoralis]|uniref:transposase family protein n=1 Tax=Metabacillus litoralis TaxID=152268 RepID=UPI0020406205|nr:transposase family protein [Metabacillus litoralis]MCM3410214.1 transposase family protein [Metabacillus litoralis]